MSLTVGDWQVWLDLPATKVLLAEFEQERKMCEQKLKTSKFETIEDFRACQAELRAIEKWATKPQERMQALLKHQTTETA